MTKDKIVLFQRFKIQEMNKMTTKIKIPHKILTNKIIINSKIQIQKIQIKNL